MGSSPHGGDNDHFTPDTQYPERFAQQALGQNFKACAMPARNTLTCRAVVPLCGTKAEVTVPSLDDWEKDLQENPQCSVQPKLLPVDFRSPLATVVQSN
jgi:hypothetical protein